MTEDTNAADVAAKELQGRVEEFNKELLPLLGKYELGLGASAFVNPNGTIGARPIMFDQRKKEAPKSEDGVNTDATPGHEEHEEIVDIKEVQKVVEG